MKTLACMRCGDPVEVHPKTRRVNCDFCRIEIESENNRAAYIKYRRGQTEWINKNKQIAKNWRARNREFIREYIAERSR